jgi:hypothetical protein
VAALKGKIAALTNFLETSFNRTFIRAYAEQLHDIELRLLAAQLSGWVRYAGKENLTETDLNRLGVTDIDPDDVNQYMDSQQLDELGKIMGVLRDDGQRATGVVTVQTASDQTRVPEGMEVATQPDFQGNYRSFSVDANSDGEIDEDSNDYVTPSAGNTTVDVDVIANDIGTEFNNALISFLPNPPVGVEGVSNQTAATGGENVQSDESLREDIENAVFETSGGGTVVGIEGFVADNATGVSDVELDEFTDEDPPFVDVIVDGGSEQDVLDAIDDSRPAGVRHNLVRPESVLLGVTTELVGTDIDISFVESEIDSYLTDLSLGDEYRRSKLMQRILNSDTDMADLETLTTLLIEVSNEVHEYSSGTDIYRLNQFPVGDVVSDTNLYQSSIDVYELSYDEINDNSNVSVRAVVAGEVITLTRGTDYEVVDDSGNGDNDSIDFSIGGDDPDDQSVFETDYHHESWTIDSTIEDEQGNTYDQGTDWDLVDDDSDSRKDSIDWSIGGSSPSDGDTFTVDYEPRRVIARDSPTTKRQKFDPSQRIEIIVI